MNKVISIYSPEWHPYTGYGRKAVELTRHATKMGYHVNVMGGAPHKYADLAPSDVAPALASPKIIPALGGIVLGYPTLVSGYPEMLRHGPILIQTMFESTRFPDGWSRWLNRADAIAVPTPWLVDAMRDNGVNTPVSVIREGVSDVFKPVKRVRYPKQFAFVWVASDMMRKGYDVLIKAWAKAFNGSDRHKLIMKVKPGALGKFSGFKNLNIEILDQDMSDDELLDLYARCHAMVSPSRGEGFGLPAREFAATGGPVIATNWGGLADNIRSWAYPLQYDLAPAWYVSEQIKHPRFEGLGEWAEPRIDNLVQLMQYVASRPRWDMWHKAPPRGVKVANQSERVAAQVRKLYSWQTFSEEMLELWEAVASGNIRTA